LTQDITQLPAFQELNKQLGDNAHLIELNRLIINFVNYIETHDLKSIFNYANKLIISLNMLGNSIISSGIERANVLKFDTAIRSIQNVIYKESKRILNLHDLRGVTLHFPELKDILDKPPVPTWDFGPGKSPAQSRIRQRWHRTKDLMKRLELENKDEEAIKKKLKGNNMSADELMKLAERFEKKAQEANLQEVILCTKSALELVREIHFSAKNRNEQEVPRNMLALMAQHALQDLSHVLSLLGAQSQILDPSQSDEVIDPSDREEQVGD
jgi:hypothetical protein